MPRIAIAQAEIAPTLDEGLARTAQLARDAAGAGAELVVFPETWLPGYPAWLDVCRDVGLWDHPPVKAIYARMAAQSVTIPGDAAESLSSTARDTGAALVGGVIERVVSGKGAGTLYNAILTF